MSTATEAALAAYRAMPDEIARRLPPAVYSSNTPGRRLCLIQRGGPLPPELVDVPPGATAESMNATLRPAPTRQQVCAMEVGVWFGWNHAGADPRHPAHAVPCALYDPDDELSALA